MKKLHRKNLLLLIVTVLFTVLLVIGAKQNVVHAQDPPTPVIIAHEGINQIEAFMWPIGVQLTVFIDDDQDLDNGFIRQGEIISEEAYWDPSLTSGVWYLGEEFDLEPGHYVTITDDQTTKVVLVEPLSFDWIDEGNDTAGGIGPALKEVRVSIEADYEIHWTNPIIGPDGTWLASFSTDIVNAHFGTAYVEDDDGDKTMAQWEEPIPPTMSVYLNDEKVIKSSGWVLGDMVTLTIDDPATGENPDFMDELLVMPADWDPAVGLIEFVWKDQIALVPGFIITMAGETATITYEVELLEVTEIDPESDIVQGIAAPGEWVAVFVPGEQWAFRSVFADGAGLWTADFSVLSDDNMDQGLLDIIPGVVGLAGVNDENWNSTMYRWELLDTIDDTDGDGVLDAVDNAPTIYNPDQSDLDGDGVGDVADPCPSDLTDTCDQTNSAAAVIGSTGGLLVTTGSEVSVSIPAGALIDDVSISITDLGSGFELNTDLGLSEAVFGVEIGPPGTTFSIPITIVFSWQDSDDDGIVDGTTIAEVDLFIVKDGLAYTPPCVSYADCDQDNNTIEFFITSLSEWTMAALKNTPPSANTGGPYYANEGSSITLDASGTTDPEGNITSYVWDLDTDGNFDDGAGLTISLSVPQEGEYIIRLLVVDDFGEQDIAETVVYVSNVAPDLGNIVSPLEPVQLGNEIQASASFTDPGADNWTAVWNWGDGTSADGTVTNFLAKGTHIYQEAGVYTIQLTVSDGTDSGSATYEYIVVYDPEGGFITGGGWIQSPEGAYTPDPTMSGQATFGFISKYKKGADVPTGNTEFHFKTATFHFKSTIYQWLVIAGKKAMFKGEGDLNGQGGYGFMISTLDGDLLGGDGLDKFRIKIWELGTETIVYDNQLGDVEDADPTTILDGGSIVVHKN